jgi:CubicO group peptidase (beta-lactamase class C family)
VFADAELFGETWAVAASHRGALIYERYEGRLPGWGEPGEIVTQSSGLLSWSVAKSVLHAGVGILVGEGRLRLDEPAGVRSWSDSTDPRHAITLEHLLTMRDGLDFVEDYDPGGGRSDVITMLFTGIEDMAAFAAERALAAPAGERYSYSSGTSNIVSSLVAAQVGTGAAYEDWLKRALLDRIGMASATVDTDGAGTWIASSYMRATARDWLRFGELYLRDGVWAGERILPEGWVDHGRRPRSPDPDGTWHGAHWWSDGPGTGPFWAEGFEGQMILVCPGTDLVVVRFGRTPESSEPMAELRRRILSAVS